MWSLLGEWWLEGGRGGHRGGHTLCLNLGMVTRTRSNCANSPMRTRRICMLFCRCFIQFNKKCPLKRLYSSGSIFADLWIQTVVEAHRITLCVFFSPGMPASCSRESPCVPGTCQAVGRPRWVRPVPAHKHGLETEKPVCLHALVRCISDAHRCCCCEHKFVEKKFISEIVMVKNPGMGVETLTSQRHGCQTGEQVSLL